MKIIVGQQRDRNKGIGKSAAFKANMITPVSKVVFTRGDVILII